MRCIYTAILFSSLLPAVTSATTNHSGTVNLPLDLITVSGNLGPVYLANISIGNPPQTVLVQVDTGSADLWVFSNKNTCNVTGGCYGGSFNPAASNSFQNEIPNQFRWAYGTGNNGSGDYIREDVQIGNVTLKNIRLGLTTQADGEKPVHGILGLGDPGQEFKLANGSAPNYSNVPIELANQQFINTPAFSLYLDSNDRPTSGSVLFGGIDEAKYTPPLREFPILKSGNSYTAYYIQLAGVGYSSTFSNGTRSTEWPSNSSVTGIKSFIDSGAPKAFLPGHLAVPLILNAGAQYDQQRDVSVIQCSARESNDTVDFVVGSGQPDESVVIRVPLRQLVDQFPDPDPPVIAEEDACQFLISPGPNQVGILGDGFLRGAYVVHDLKRHVLGFAQARLGVEECDVRVL